MMRLAAVAFLGGVSALASAAADAQATNAAPTPPPTTAETPAAPPGNAEAKASAGAPSDIVVTGSRVIKNGNNSPTPLTVISTDQLLKLQPTTVVDAVNLAPALQGSQSTTSNPGGGQRNGAAAYINLRNMGDLRTLVLMDGHRVVPTINGMNANVDSWVIPQLLIQRVDVVTGGVSAVYGSDAVSGVVNFVTDKSFNGFKVQASSGVSDYGDDNIIDVGVAAGSKFAGDRGHIELSAQYHRDPGIPDQLKRPFFAQSLGGSGLGTAASPYFNVTDQRISNASFGGLITSGPLANLQFAQNGVLSAFNAGTPTGTANVSSGGDGAWYRSASIKSALMFKQLFGRLDYELTDDVHAYAQATWTDNHTRNGFRAPLETVNIGYNNPFLATVQQPYQMIIAAQAAANLNGSFAYRRFIDIPATANQWTRTYMVMGGVDGSIGDYKWDIGFQHSVSKLKAQNDVNVDQGRFFAAANAVVSPANGQVVCRAALTNANYAGCVPINLFGPSSISQQALDYILAKTINTNRTALDEVEGSLTDAPFETWAGPVNMALSGGWRRIGWSVTSNATPSDPIDCNGIQFSCTSTTLRWLQTTSPSLAKVTQDVTEGAYEIDLPLAKDAPFATALNLNGAVRYTHYSTSGNVTTWKLGLVWRSAPDLMLRGTRSRDIRAPNVFELFGPTSIAPSNLNDPLTNRSATVGVATISNPNLTPEKAKSWTGGIVWTPGFIPRFSLSIDGYWIKVENAIVNVQGNSASILNFCAQTQAADPACGEVIVRPLPWTNTTAANFPTAVYQKWLNIASFKTYGVDFEANYRLNIASRPLSLRALLSYQPKLVFDQGPFGVIDFGNVATAGTLFPASPAIKYTVLASYDVTDRFNVSWLQRGRGSMKAFAVTKGLPEKVFLDGKDRDPATTYSNLTLAYTIKQGSGGGESQLYFNVQNLFNRQPKVRYAGANANPGLGLFGFFPPNGDDIVGRYFTVGLRAHF